MTQIKTADLVDAHDQALRYCNAPLQPYGRKRAFSGRIATVKTFEDNTLVRSTLEQPGDGRVLVIDGGGSTRCALVGDMIATLGTGNGWRGIIIHGAIRDSVEIDAMDFGVFALGRSPKKSAKNGIGQTDVVVSFGNVDFVPGQYVYCDDDGILVSERNLV